MKTFNTLFLSGVALTMITLTSSAFPHSQNGTVTKELNNIAFQNLDIHSFFTVKLTQSKQYRVKITVPERFEPNLISRIEDNKLFLDIKKKYNTLNRNDNATVEISAPSFKEINLSGIVNMTVEGDWDLENVELNLSGTANLTTDTHKMNIKNLDIAQSGMSHINATLNVTNLEIDNSGASHLTLNKSNQDSGNLANIDISGNSQINLSKHPFKVINLDASGNSHIKVFPVQRLNADASGTSSVRYIESSKTLKKNLNTSGCASVAKD